MWRKKIVITFLNQAIFFLNKAGSGHMDTIIGALPLTKEKHTMVTEITETDKWGVMNLKKQKKWKWSNIKSDIAFEMWLNWIILKIKWWNSPGHI